jgi:hypothetical protein
MVGLLIWLLVFALIIWAAYYILGMLPIPEPPKAIIMIVLAIIFLLILLQALFGGLGLPGVRWDRPL